MHQMQIKSISFLSLVLLLLGACTKPQVLDTNQAIDNNEWHYKDAIKEDFKITDSLKRYNLDFKFRNTSSYPFANLYVIMRLKGPRLNKQLRYQFQVTDTKGRWLGKGSGDRFQLILPLYQNFKFPDTGKFSIEVEQNMKNNPLQGVSDIGISIKENTN